MCQDIFRHYLDCQEYVKTNSDNIKNVKHMSRLIKTNLKQSRIGRDYSRLLSDDTGIVDNFLDNVNTSTVKTLVKKNQEPF